jgi:hypothetical protein
MTIKSFDIDIDGKKEIIEYEDDLLFGDLEAIVNISVDLSDVTKPKVDLPKYRMNILTKVLRKAPFPVDSPEAIRNLKAKTAKQIISEVMKDYPLMRFLEDWMVTFVGTQEATSSPTVSTTSLPKVSAGTKDK